MAKYAEDTRVPVERSRAELYRVLERYGATETLVHDAPGRLRVGFILAGLRIAVPFDLPRPDAFPTSAAYERELRRRWRVVILVLKGKLESVAEGAESVDQAFLAHLMLPDGSTVGDEAIPAVRAAYRAGQMPDTLLPGLPRAKVIALPEGGRR